jgi:alkylated DNA repair dioxygenase AlkB
MEPQLDLFTAQPLSPSPEVVQRDGLALRYWRHWLADADAVLDQLLALVPWTQETITMWGKTHPIPRLTCWMGDPGCHYTYSGVSNTIQPWIPAVEAIREQVEAAVGSRFNSLLLNHYRDGRDKLDWHADDEPELDPERPIASLSLGAARSFRLKPRRSSGRGVEVLVYELGHGDLLVMDPPTQLHWLHQVPQRLRVRERRINLTFRAIRPEAIRHV